MIAWNDVQRSAALVTEHLVAVIVGFMLMAAGLGMGVTIVLLPVGIPVGILGLLAFVWGLLAWDSQ